MIDSFNYFILTNLSIFVPEISYIVYFQIGVIMLKFTGSIALHEQVLRIGYKKFNEF